MYSNSLADHIANNTLHIYQLGFSQGSLILSISISLGEFVNNIVFLNEKACFALFWYGVELLYLVMLKIRAHTFLCIR